jgi:hypothetical protein
VRGPEQFLTKKRPRNNFSNPEYLREDPKCRRFRLRCSRRTRRRACPRRQGAGRTIRGSWDDYEGAPAEGTLSKLARLWGVMGGRRAIEVLVREAGFGRQEIGPASRLEPASPAMVRDRERCPPCLLRCRCRAHSEARGAGRAPRPRVGNHDPRLEPRLRRWFGGQCRAARDRPQSRPMQPPCNGSSTLFCCRSPRFFC